MTPYVYPHLPRVTHWTIHQGTPSTWPCEAAAKRYLFRPGARRKSLRKQHTEQNLDPSKGDQSLSVDRAATNDVEIPDAEAVGPATNANKSVAASGAEPTEARATLEVVTEVPTEVNVAVSAQRDRTPNGASGGSQISKHFFARFHYSPGHDLESLWWLLNFCVFVYLNTTVVLRAISHPQASAATTTDVEGSAEPDAEPELKNPDEDPEFQKLLRELFQDRKARVYALTDGDHFLRYVARLHQSLWPVGDILNELRGELVDCYEDAEKDCETYFSPKVWEGFYEQFKKAVGRIGEVVKDILPLDEVEDEPAGDWVTERGEKSQEKVKGTAKGVEGKLAATSDSGNDASTPTTEINVPVGCTPTKSSGSARATGASIPATHEEDAHAQVLETPANHSAKTSATSTVPVIHASGSAQVGQKRKRVSASEVDVDTKRVRT